MTYFSKGIGLSVIIRPVMIVRIIEFVDFVAGVRQLIEINWVEVMDTISKGGSFARSFVIDKDH